MTREPAHSSLVKELIEATTAYRNCMEVHTRTANYLGGSFFSIVHAIRRTEFPQSNIPTMCTVINSILLTLQPGKVNDNEILHEIQKLLEDLDSRTN